MGRRSLTITLLLLAPALTVVGIGTFWGLETERQALEEQALREARAALANGARILAGDLVARMDRSLEAGRDLLLGRGGPEEQPAADGDPLLVVLDPNGRRLVPPAPAEFLLLDDITADLPLRERDDLELARALMNKSDAKAARAILDGLASSGNVNAAAQARFRIATTGGDLVEMWTLATKPQGLSSAQRFACAKRLVSDAVERRDADRLETYLTHTWTWLQGHLLAGAAPARWWVQELTAMAESFDSERAAWIRDGADGRQREAARLRELPASVSVPETRTWLPIGARRALAIAVVANDGTRAGTVVVLPPKEPDISRITDVVSGLHGRGWRVQSATTRGQASVDDVVASIGGPLPDHVLLATRVDDETPFPWRTVVGAAFLIACLGLMGLGVALALRSARQRERMLAARTEFLATVAHQLKTPVANLRLFAETLSSGQVDEEADRQRMHGIIESEAGRLSDQVERVLSVVRLDETGTVDPEAGEEIAIGSLLAGLEERWRRMANTRSVRFEMEIPEHLPAVRGDERALGDALQNVVDNAVRFTREGGSVRVGATITNGEVRVRVRDEGPGITDGQRERIFERFFRGDDARRRAGEGTGLGLAIARDGARRAGGDVVIEQTGAGGTTMAVSLPVSERSET